MRFAKLVFSIAGVWGMLVLTPVYFMFASLSRQYPPQITHPEFYDGFAGVTFAWQVAFFVIARDPVRFRPIMVAAVLEKFSYGATVSVLYTQGRLYAGQLAWGGPDLVWGFLFLAAFLKTSSDGARRGP